MVITLQADLGTLLPNLISTTVICILLFIPKAELGSEFVHARNDELVNYLLVYPFIVKLNCIYSPTLYTFVIRIVHC